MSNFNSIQMNTPRGTANYPYLNTPDTKFNPDGDYKVNLALEDNEANRKFISKLEANRDKLLADFAPANEAKAKGKKVMLADLYEETDEGEIILKFKQRAVIRTKAGKTFNKKVALFDRHGKPMTDIIGYGSTIKVCFDMCPYYTPSTKLAGCSLRLVAVQVIDLKSGDGMDDGSAYGFSEEEGTYEASESEEESNNVFKDESIDDFEDDEVDEASRF